jgi:hypothetical protein
MVVVATQARLSALLLRRHCFWGALSHSIRLYVLSLPLPSALPVLVSCMVVVATQAQLSALLSCRHCFWRAVLHSSHLYVLSLPLLSVLPVLVSCVVLVATQALDKEFLLKHVESLRETQAILDKIAAEMNARDNVDGDSAALPSQALDSNAFDLDDCMGDGTVSTREGMVTRRTIRRQQL